MLITFDNIYYRCRDWEVVNKAMNIIEAAKTLKQYCEDCGSSCKGCIFHDEECMFYATLPDEWAIPNPDSISDEIQHVSYDDAQLGREK